jgi:heavy metal sensor kinase
MINRLDVKIQGHLGNFSYYALLFDRKSRKEAIRIIADNIKWAASTVGDDQALWLMLSPQKEIITSSNQEPWQATVDAIIKAIPELRNYDELPQPVHPETLDQQGLRFREVEGVKQIAVFKTAQYPGKPGRFRTAFMKYHNGMIMIGVYGLQDIHQQMARYRQVLAIAFSVVLVVGGGLGFLITRQAMVGVQRVTQTAQAIGQGDLSRRVTLRHQGREIEDLAHAFNEMLSRIQILIKELKEVTTNIAHDLRSPLTSIRGMAEAALQDPGDMETFQDTHGRIVAECDRLINIINTMLDMAAMDTGTIELPQTTVDITALVQGACTLFRPVADDKAICLHLNNSIKTVHVRGSKENLQRVVSNIIDNAIKFTPEGGRITVDIIAKDSQVSISVQDTGIGISPEYQQRIFDRFFRVDPSRTTDGNGLGLSLAQSIIKAHGGQITVESEEGKGSRFTIVLPQS